MEIAEKRKLSVPGWVYGAFSRPWYLWLGWLMEAGILFVFLSVAYTQFAEDEPRAGWVMLLLTLVFGGPGLWVLTGYKPQPGSKFGKFDIGLIVCFALWVALFGYLMFWNVAFLESPFGTPNITGSPK